jgi:hypothetical protein
MAISISEIKQQVVLTLYDYMLTSDEEAYWFSIQAIREALEPGVSGALARIALDGLKKEGSVDEGFDDSNLLATFSLTERGILVAEQAIMTRGIDLKEYSPAPSADRILTRLDDLARIQRIEGAISEIGKELRENNEVAAALGEDRDILAGEVAAAEVIVSRERFRRYRLIALLVPTLRYLADKFIGSAVGEAAKRLIKLLLES